MKTLFNPPSLCKHYRSDTFGWEEEEVRASLPTYTAEAAHLSVTPLGDVWETEREPDNTQHPHPSGIITAKSFSSQGHAKSCPPFFKSDFAAKQIEAEAVLNGAAGSPPSAWEPHARITESFAWDMRVFLSPTKQVHNVYSLRNVTLRHCQRNDSKH